MKRLFFVLIAGVLATLVTSCFNKEKNGLPPSTGGVADVLIVIPNPQWETLIGATCKDLLSSSQEGLNQAESTFDLVQIQHNEFTGLFLKYRKIIKVFVSDTVNKSQIVFRNDLYSSPQIIIELHAKTEAEAINLLKSKGPSLVEKLRLTERTRLIKAFRSKSNIDLSKKVAEKFGFKLVFPSSFFEAKTATNFGWYRLETPKYSQGILIYTRPFADSSQLNPSQIIAYRNTVTRLYIPGELKDSYMSTDTVSMPISFVKPFAGMKAIETRGLWKTEGDFMGGPFISYTFHDKPNNRIVTLEGYVYYPSQDKRDLLMQLEAILHSYEVK